MPERIFSGKTIQVSITDDVSPEVHRFRNFGEEVWRTGIGKTSSVSLQEIDATKNTFKVTEAKSRQVKQAITGITAIAGKHKFKETLIV